jgi:hypothetical protein
LPPTTPPATAQQKAVASGNKAIAMGPGAKATALRTEALEETKQFGIRFKAPKSKAGRRDITLPDALIETLRDHRRAQLELRFKLGIGKLPDDALLFSNLDGGPLRPGNMSSVWSEDAEGLGVPEVTFHGLRHTHASQLIAENVASSRSPSVWDTPSRASRLRSTPICFIPTTARQPRRSTPRWRAFRRASGANWVPIRGSFLREALET